ncbi:RDD family protein [uncultured Bacteroides sp.]|uniref:RDD family protein n=1 Tax=uncultured Bacteroides sp. TaxID=162156 RepID=UPI00262C61BF|nr:RDD family protein [uncultured Bacteroides sp.]
MNQSSIITGQFVRINQTPASVGERIFAFLLDMIFLALYVWGTFQVLDIFMDGVPRIFGLTFLFLVYLPVLMYPFLCDLFNQGQSIGKKLFHLRVVKKDGSTPSLGAYLLRWLLLLVDVFMTMGLGVLVILLTKNHQRIGDLAAGTIVIREKNYRKIHVSLDEFDYLMKGYKPTYPQAADLSLEQIDVITRTLNSGQKDRARRIALLTDKVQQLFAIHPPEVDKEKFLQTVLRDYQYYALEEI